MIGLRQRNLFQQGPSFGLEKFQVSDYIQKILMWFFRRFHPHDPWVKNCYCFLSTLNPYQILITIGQFWDAIVV
jgi:hypothetical protein